MQQALPWLHIYITGVNTLNIDSGASNVHCHNTFAAPGGLSCPCRVLRGHSTALLVEKQETCMATGMFAVLADALITYQSSR